MTTNETELLKLEIQLRTLELQNLEEKKRLQSEKRFSSQSALNIFVWFTIAMVAASIILIFATTNAV